MAEDDDVMPPAKMDGPKTWDGKVWADFYVRHLIRDLEPEAQAIVIAQLRDVPAKAGRKAGAAWPGDDALVAEIDRRVAEGEQPKAVAYDLALQAEGEGRLTREEKRDRLLARRTKVRKQTNKARQT